MTKKFTPTELGFVSFGESASKDNILFSPRFVNESFTRLLILNYTGEILNQIKVDSGGFCADFKQIITPDNNILYSYNKNLGRFKGANGWYENCAVELLDDTLRPIGKSLQSLPFGSVTGSDFAQCHDSLIIDANHYYILVNKAQENSNSAKIVASPFAKFSNKIVNCIVQEIENNQVVWQFETADYPELFEASFCHATTLLYRTAADYAHLNSIAVTPDNKYIYLSYRNIGIVKVKKETKTIEWVWGNKMSTVKTPANFEMFKFQHDMRVIDNDYISIFDNSNARAIKCRIEDAQVKDITEVLGEVQKNDSMGGCIFGDSFVDICSGYRLPLTKDNKWAPGVIEKDLATKKTNLSINFDKQYTVYRVARGKA